MMTRSRRLLLAYLGAALWLSGCRGNDDDHAPPGPDVLEGETTTPFRPAPVLAGSAPEDSTKDSGAMTSDAATAAGADAGVDGGSYYDAGFPQLPWFDAGALFPGMADAAP